jgi:nucleoside-diphosphate-sugar epimerase
MKVVVIGGTGHVGTYLIPRLVRAAHDVVVVSRGKSKPYTSHAAWQDVETVCIDRDAAEKVGSFASSITDLKPDVVIDMICFDEKSAAQLVEALRNRIGQLLVCGTIWVHGPSVTVPTLEHENITPFGEYGILKARMREYLLNEARVKGFPVTLIHPGHIVGPGWNIVNPLGNFNPDVFTRIAAGEAIKLPTLGLETVHHVHADDVAQLFQRAMENWGAASGEEFHVVSEQAISLKGYAEAVAAWFGKEAVLEFSAADTWEQDFSEEDVGFTWDHILHSPNCSIEKAKKLLGYRPRYSSLQAVFEALTWLIEEGMVKSPKSG